MKFIWHHNSWPWGKTVKIIKSDGSAIIEMSFEDNQPGVCYISGLSVIEPQRKKGIATKLMFACESFCREHNIFRIDLDSVLTDWMQDFYKKCGYVPIKEENDFMRMYKMINTTNEHCYIHKDALLEWAKERQKHYRKRADDIADTSNPDLPFFEGKENTFTEVIDKIESL